MAVRTRSIKDVDVTRIKRDERNIITLPYNVDASTFVAPTVELLDDGRIKLNGSTPVNANVMLFSQTVNLSKGTYYVNSTDKYLFRIASIGVDISTTFDEDIQNAQIQLVLLKNKTFNNEIIEPIVSKDKLINYFDVQTKRSREIAWFNSVGVDNDGKAIKAENFSQQQESVVAGLTQRLSVLKNELWYNFSFGQPLTDKIRSKELIDSFVSTTISAHPDVVDIISFSSSITNRKYSCNARIKSIYGEVNLTI